MSALETPLYVSRVHRTVNRRAGRPGGASRAYQRHARRRKRVGQCVPQRKLAVRFAIVSGP